MIDIIKNIQGIHSKIARDVFGEKDVMVFCITCGREEIVDPAYCLAHGWPKCCGYTMRFEKKGQENGK